MRKSLIFCPTYTQFSAQHQLDTSVLFPDIENFPGNMYAGYVKVTNNRQYYYWVFQNQNNSQDGPTIMWMNGGPGCSSLEGATIEVGPVILPRMANANNSQPQFSNAEYSWNSIANLIFIEFPAGVGFSTKPDNLPQNGESYAGVYVQSLAYEIDNYNSNPQTAQKFPLKGFSTGNGCTHPDFQCQMQNYGQWSQMRQLYEQGKVSEKIFQDYMGTCFMNEDIMQQLNTDACAELENKIYQSAGGDYNTNPPFINWYDIYRACEPENGPNGVPQKTHNQARFRKNFRDKNSTENNSFVISPNSPCVDDTVLNNFLNNKSKWNQLNVNSTLYPDDFEWADCVNNYNQLAFTITNGSYWIYKQLINRGYKILIYSGNTDLCVPIPGTRKQITMLREELDLSIIEPLRPWYVPGNTTSQPQLGGYVERYKGLTFVEIQGVGHMVPEWARSAALQMVTSLITGKKFPTYDSLASNNFDKDEL